MEQNKWMWLGGALLAGLVIGYIARGVTTLSPTTQNPEPTPMTQAENLPHSGFTLHIDAEKHFPADEKKIAHHWCKQVKGGMFECQLYDSDDKDARLVGVETVVDTKTWQAFDADEQGLWHYHKEEIPKINAKLPDLSEEEAAKVVQMLNETYGKVYLLWDPAQSDLPIGQPSITILE
ncbi:DUF1264 domain-containing protein [Candidatus Gottesmanbacteria bacterium]|nr:DUF1264 domain-containing protein [Candidatus Gottesmanbacteria bacterium]